VPSTNFDPIDPFEGKSEEFRRGYQEGYSRGYAHAIGQEKYDEYAWEVSLTDHFPGYTTDFAAGYQAGFMQTYRESWADAGNELAHE
jgi:flagellar biosynthesis/type III secretory pathway protein FliH